MNAGKYGPEKTPYLNTFHAVWRLNEYTTKMESAQNINAKSQYVKSMSYAHCIQALGMHNNESSEAALQWCS